MFKAYVSTRTLTPSKEDKGCLDWNEEIGFDEVKVAECDTFKECFNKLMRECDGSKWCSYPSVYIDSDDEGEVFESTVVYCKCECCGHEDYERIENTYSKYKGDK